MPILWVTKKIRIEIFTNTAAGWIKAFNRDLPYDDFLTEQIAGDMLPNPSNDQLIATAYHRNTQTNTEGGTDDEEFRVAAVMDQNGQHTGSFHGNIIWLCSVP